MTPSPSIQDRYRELLSLAQLYLLQEYSLSDRILAESASYHYFRDYVAKRQGNKTPVSPAAPQPAPPPPKQSLAPPIPLPQPPTPKPPVAAPVAPSQESQSNVAIMAVPKRPPLPAPPPVPLSEAKKPPKEKTAFALEVSPKPDPMSFDELRKLAAERLPGLAIVDNVPDDSEARRLARAWDQKTEIPHVLILSFDEAPKPRAFLNNLAKALHVHGVDAQVIRAAKIEQDQAWEGFLQSDQLKLVIASSYGIDALPNLAKHYREAAKQARHFLGDVPLLLLSDVAFYLREPTLKPSLWSAIMQGMRS